MNEQLLKVSAPWSKPYEEVASTPHLLLYIQGLNFIQKITTCTTRVQRRPIEASIVITSNSSHKICFRLFGVDCVH